MVGVLSCGFWLGLVGGVTAQPTIARIEGSIVDPSGRPLPGTTVTVAPAGDRAAAASPDRAGPDPRSRPASTMTDRDGRFRIAVASGAYVVTATPPGYAPVTVPVTAAPGQTATVELTTTVAPVVEVVDVVGSTGAGLPLETEEIAADLLRVFQLPTDRFQEALPLLPGVVRDPRGRLSFNGTRPSQSTLLVNGANATDPVTGQFAVELPLSVIDTVEVHAIPYSAEFGQVSGAVTSVRTRAGGDEWKVEVGSLFPKPRFRDGTFKGINTATPRAQVSGPLRRGRAWFSQGVSYRFVRSRVREPLPGGDEEIVEGYDAFTQIDLRLSDRHSLTATLSVFPTTVSNRGISSLNRAAATPTTGSDGWNVAISDQWASGTDTLWRTQVAVRGFALDVRPQGTGVTRLTPDGLRGNYFNTIDRTSRQVELSLARTHSHTWGGQRHLVTVGAQMRSTSFEGADRSGPIEVRGAAGQLLRRITFRGPGVLAASDRITSGYLQDHWQLGSRLAVDLGIRLDHAAMLQQTHLSPRAAVSLALDPDGRTFVKGGWGLFFDHVFLHVGAFEQFQQRVEQDFLGVADRPAGPATVFANRADPDLDQPMSRVWNVEFDHRLTPALLLRVNYREHHAIERPLVQRVADAAGAALLLSSAGQLTAREFDTTVRWTVADHGDLFVSFSKIRTAGDLNDFGLLYDTVRDPLILPNDVGAQPFDVPNRVLIWGILALPRGITLTPGIEWRDGFSYSVFTERYDVIGARNDARLPAFLSADLAVTKTVTVLGRQTSLGVQLYNLTGHDNSRDVVANIASPDFLALRNSIGTSMSVKLGFDF